MGTIFEMSALKESRTLPSQIDTRLREIGSVDLTIDDCHIPTASLWSLASGKWMHSEVSG